MSYQATPKLSLFFGYHASESGFKNNLYDVANIEPPEIQLSRSYTGRHIGCAGDNVPP